MDPRVAAGLTSTQAPAPPRLRVITAALMLSLFLAAAETTHL